MGLPAFTVTGDIDEITGTISGTDLGEYPPTTLRFRFTTNLYNASDIVTYSGQMYKIGTVYAGITEAGSLKQGLMSGNQVVLSDDDVQLLAEDDDLNINGLQWKVTLEAPNGSTTGWQQLTEFWFPAQANGSSINLASVARVLPITVTPLIRTGANVSDIIDIPSGVQTFLTTTNPSLRATAAGMYPIFVVDTYYGGELGEGDDTNCIQKTLDACSEMGGGVVILPPHNDTWTSSGGPYYYYQQLVMPKWVHFAGMGWHSFAAAGLISRMRQLTGVNDDSIIFNAYDDALTTPFVGPFGISDMVLRGADDATAGHAISFRASDGRKVGMMDNSVIERMEFRGFAESGIYCRAASPMSISDVHGIYNGRYVVEIEDENAAGYGDFGQIHQVLLRNISGDANMGGGADASGATIYLNGLREDKAVVTIQGLKSEYRIRSESDSGDGVQMGNLHALLIENCGCPITVTGVKHIATGSQTRKPGNVIQVLGAAMPNLTWSAVDVRKDVAAQTVGDEPALVYDAVNDRSINAAQGYLLSATASSGTQRGLQIEHTVNQSGTASYRSLDVNVNETATGSGTGRMLSLSKDGSTRFFVSHNGQCTANQGFYVGGEADTLIDRSAAGRITVADAEVPTANAISAVTAKATPIDADQLPLFDSAASDALKSLTVANLSSTVLAGEAATATALATARTIDNVSFDGTANIVTPGAKALSPVSYVSGSYYFCSDAHGVTTSNGLSNGTIRTSAWVVGESITVTRLGVEFTVAGDAASVYRIGIWASDGAGGKPSTLVLDAGTISTGTSDSGDVATGGTPDVYEITVSQALSPGVYWVGGVVQGVTTTQPTMRVVQGTPFFGGPVASLPSTSQMSSPQSGFIQGGVTGALPAFSGTGISVYAPRVVFKVS